MKRKCKFSISIKLNQISFWQYFILIQICVGPKVTLCQLQRDEESLIVLVKSFNCIGFWTDIELDQSLILPIFHFSFFCHFISICSFQTKKKGSRRSL